MTSVISMLRAVNVGGNNKIKMEELRGLYQSLDLVAPRTYIQSGNVVFETKQKDMEALTRRIRAAIDEKFAVRCEVILRTAHELEDVIARNPFAGRSDVPPNKLLVTFLAKMPDSQAPVRIRNLPPLPEELHLEGRELYVYFPNGAGTSKLSPSVIERALGVPGTARNWNTVQKLLALAGG